MTSHLAEYELNMKYFFTSLFIILFCSGVWAAESVQIINDDSAVYAEPDSNAQVLTRLKKGRSLQTDGRVQNGFTHLKTKSGRELWVKSSDITFGDANTDLENGEAPPPRPRRHTASHDDRSEHEFPRFTYDLGASSGSVDGLTYTEIDLGLNTFFIDWLAWRNAVFYRFQSGASSVYGLDTSVRGVLGVGGRSLGMTLFAGPGFRFINQGQNAPFVEGGIIAKVAGLALGVGAKTIFNSMASSGSPDDHQIFLILSGGGSF
jgi:hypothetical protein